MQHHRVFWVLMESATIMGFSIPFWLGFGYLSFVIMMMSRLWWAVLVISPTFLVVCKFLQRDDKDIGKVLFRAARLLSVKRLTPTISKRH